MTKEDIEKGAKKQLKGIVPCEWNQEPFIDIFVRAANWRINSVWHKDIQKGKSKKPILVKFDNGLFNLFEDIRDLKGIEDKVSIFAYIKDLLPNKEEQA